MIQEVSCHVLSLPGAVAVLAVTASVAGAQTETLMYDHVHMSVPDPQASAQWFHDHIGGEFVDGRTDRLLFGTTRIMWLGSRGEARRPSAGGVIDHLGFSFSDLSVKLAEVEGAGATVTTPRRDVEGPVRLELIEDPQHLGREPQEASSGTTTILVASVHHSGAGWTGSSIRATSCATPRSITLAGAQSTSTRRWGKGLEITSPRRDMTLPNGQIAFFYVAGPHGRSRVRRRARDMR